MVKLYKGAAALGLMLLAATAWATPKYVLTVPSQQTWKAGSQIEPVMPKGYSLTKGHVFGFVPTNAALNAQNSPMNDPYAPLQIGYDKIWGCNNLGQYCYTNGSYFTPPQLQPYVMTGMRRIYLIWYGNWQGNTGTTLIPQFINALNYSPYESILTTYTFNGAPVSPGIFVAGQYTAPMTFGTSISDADVQSLVQEAIAAGAFPVDPNGIYLVLTAANVAESASGNPAYGGGMCTAYCGWHNDGLYFGSTDIKYAFIGNGQSCGWNSVAGQSAPGSWPGACIPLKPQSNGPFTPSDWNSPNGNPGADGMVSVIAHETEEAATDPGVSGNIPSGYIGFDFWAGAGYENGDQCAWRFGANSGNMFMSNGSYANMVLNGRPYLIQKNVVLASTTAYSNYGNIGPVYLFGSYYDYPTYWANWYFNGASAVGGSADYCGLNANTL